MHHAVDKMTGKVVQQQICFAPTTAPLSCVVSYLFMSIMRSDDVKAGYARAPNRSLIRSLGIDESEMHQPFIGIANSGTLSSRVIPT
jgi:hypothetical protein